jgi:methylated-DNA-protein-cysteine methyltransferase related protein
MNFFQQVYEIVKKIPKGSVMTYGQVARALGTRDARRIGQALHTNRDRHVPCHRVVFADGSLASEYAFGGAEEQKKKLKSEGIIFIDNKVNFGYNHLILKESEENDF